MVLLGVLSSSVLRAQVAIHTRVFRTAGSYPSIVSVAPNGPVLSKAGDGSVLTLLDGFTRRDIGVPEDIIYRLHESRSAQIWSATKDGLILYSDTGNAWTLFPLQEIRAFLSASSRQLRQVALLPAELNHVFVLLPDKLLDFDDCILETFTRPIGSDFGRGRFVCFFLRDIYRNVLEHSTNISVADLRIIETRFAVIIVDEA